MLCFLVIAKNGINMNLNAFRRPTHIYRSDSCPFGLGGYSDKGFTWCFEIPEVLRFRASNNLLKYVASIISPWVDILAGRFKARKLCPLDLDDRQLNISGLAQQDQFPK